MIRPATIGLITALALGAPAIASAAPTREVAAPVATSEAMPMPAPAPASEATNYAQRQQHDQQVANYEGGSTIIIGASGAALVVLLLVLLLVI